MKNFDEVIKFRAKDGVGRLMVYCSKNKEQCLQFLAYPDGGDTKGTFKHLEAALKEHEAITSRSVAEDSIPKGELFAGGRAYTLTFKHPIELARCLESNGFRLEPLDQKP